MLTLPVALLAAVGTALQAPGDAVERDALLTASNADPLDAFGQAAAMAGDTLLVGAPLEDSDASGVDGDGTNDAASASGAAYVLVRNATGWVEEAYLKPPSMPSPVGSRFGTAVGIDGDRAIVGAPLAVGGGDAHVFVRQGTTWFVEARLSAEAPDVEDEFGAAVAIDGDTIVVGVPFDDSSSVGVGGDPFDDQAASSGAAYVFRRTGTTWVQDVYLKASNAAPGDRFGTSVAVRGDTIVVGAPGDVAPDGSGYAGAAYVFRRSGTSWSEEAYLVASNREGGAFFGESVALWGERSTVGAPFEDGSGAAHVFLREGTTWSEEALLKAADPDFYDRFGDTVALTDDLLVAGATFEDSAATGVDGDSSDDGTINSGCAYVFVRHGSRWTQAGYLKADDPHDQAELGAVAASGRRVAAGARFHSALAPNGTTIAFAGVAYTFDASSVPTAYCTPKITTSGCVAAIATIDPSQTAASGAGDYLLTATGLPDGANAVWVASATGTANLPFLGGTLCVQPPLVFGPAADAGGAMTGGCTGSRATVVNDGQVLPAGLDAGPGNRAWYQCWFRDPASPGDAGLSAGLELVFH